MSIVEGLLLFVVVAMLGESIWETAKMVWQDGKLSVDRIGALVVGLVLAVGLQIDLFAALGCPFKYPWVGMILTGILLSRGSNFIHDLLNKIAGIKTLPDVVEVKETPPKTIEPTGTITNTEKL